MPKHARVHPSPDWHPVQLARIRSMTGLERIQMAAGLSSDTLEMSLLGLRRLHPDWEEAQLRKEFLRLLHGADLAERVYPGT